MRSLLALAALVLACGQVSAAVLVRHCAAPTATGCSSALWVLPTQATVVQVNRTGAPFVPLASVQPSERIAACYDDPGLVSGSSAACAAKVPGRTDQWQLKSVLYPAAPPVPKSIGLTVDASAPRWDSGAALATNVLADVSVRLYGAPAGQPKTLLDSIAWTASPVFRREATAADRWCFAATLAIDTTGDGTVDDESAQTAEWCGTFADPAPILHLLPPNGITGKAPAS
jgi:hypothetical protein